jgi:predicted nucleotidyltransferase
MATLKEVDQDVLDDIVQRIVRIADPDRILLFGSYARGEATEHSDYDLLVIKSGQFHRGQLTGEIYRGMIGAGHAVDIVVVTPEDVDRYKDSFALVIYPAILEGREIYAR